MIRWMLAHGRDADREVNPPATDEEIVVLRYEQDPATDDVTITFAHAGADDLCGWDVVERIAWRLYHKITRSNTPWAMLNPISKRYYIDAAQSVLADIMEDRAEKRREAWENTVDAMEAKGTDS